MNSLQNEVLVCNFTDSYLKIDEWKQVPIRLLSLAGIDESNGYCSDLAAGKIREAIRTESERGQHYIDDGNHHYMSRLWIEKITEPFDLVVFDHHTDMQPSALLPFLSCGNWVLKSLQEVRMLQNVWLIGPPQAEETAGEYEARIRLVDQQEADRIRPGEAFKEKADGRPVYVSVDLDVLSEKEFTSIWDQGSMTIKKLQEWLAYLQKEYDVIGIDYCG